jgi:hypothetical protein
MDDQPKKLRCTRCGKEIVGIIPKWDGEKPVCRECVFKGPEKIPVPPRRGALAVQWAESKDRARSLALPIVATAAALLTVIVIFLWMKPAALGPMDHFDITYEGSVQLDRDGQECVANLMVMSKYLVKGAISWPTRVCPATGKTYKVFREPGEVVIDCPNPGKHGLSRLWVSLKEPVVHADN